MTETETVEETAVINSKSVKDEVFKALGKAAGERCTQSAKIAEANGYEAEQVATLKNSPVHAMRMQKTVWKRISELGVQI
jgi:hypothetical protein